jgi:TRAP-type mannitol/chloroaromatic compound transport system substrate-binding protein
MMHMVINLEAWNALPHSYQAVVTQACEAANGLMLARYDAVNPSALKRLIASGAVLRPFPAAVLEACFKAANEHFAEIAAKDVYFRKALDSTNAFRKEQLAWWQMGEYAYDSLTLGPRGRV